jgi:hypothetical protein
MEQHLIPPLGGETAKRLHVVSSALNHAANRLRIASLLGGLNDDDAVLAYTSQHGCITLARGKFTIELRAEPDGELRSTAGRRCRRSQCRNRCCHG